jgi:hypothetical protein
MVKPDHIKKLRHVAEIHGTNLFHIKFLGCTNIKCQKGPVLPPAQVFYFNGFNLFFVQNNTNVKFILEVKLGTYHVSGGRVVRTQRVQPSFLEFRKRAHSRCRVFIPLPQVHSLMVPAQNVSIHISHSILEHNF